VLAFVPEKLIELVGYEAYIEFWKGNLKLVLFSHLGAV
jgi:hypothetical protein